METRGNFACFQKTCRLDKTNYRPLTILKSLSKMFETLVHSRISPYFENMCSHIANPMELTPPFSASRSSGKKKLENHNIIGLVSMDLSKAFDSLPHDLMVEKLRA